MLFHISGHEIWTPFRISHSLPDGMNSPGLPFPPLSQAALADYADSWANTLHAQQWLTQAARYPSELAAQLQTCPQWQPDADTIKRWLVSEGSCEAVDGCLIASASACAHGYHSWAKELGYIG